MGRIEHQSTEWDERLRRIKTGFALFEQAVLELCSETGFSRINVKSCTLNL